MAAEYPGGSPFWGWPLMLSPISYWVDANGMIAFTGNPVVWLGSTAVSLAAIVNLAMARRARSQVTAAPDGHTRELWIPLVGMAISYLPMVAIKRVMFLYHYLPTLSFALLAAALFLDREGWTRPGGWRGQRRGYRVVLGLTVLGFLAIAPMTYGWPVLAWVPSLRTLGEAWR